MTNFQKLIGISALIAALALAYYFVIHLPSKETRKQELLEQQQEAARKRQLLQSKCLDNIEQIYFENWNNTCQSISLKKNCILPAYLAEPINQDRDKNYNNCLKVYPN